MLLRTRYIHHKTPCGKHFKGFSVLMEPTEILGSVKLRVTYCSMKDQFCRHVARVNLSRKSAFCLPIRNLPSLLQQCEDNCYEGPVWDLFEDKGALIYGNQWAWVWKYFL